MKLSDLNRVQSLSNARRELLNRFHESRDVREAFKIDDTVNLILAISRGGRSAGALGLDDWHAILTVIDVALCRTIGTIDRELSSLGITIDSDVAKGADS